MKRRIISFALVAVMLFLSVFAASCGNDSTPVVMELDGYKITAAMYQYWASSMKGQYIYYYEDVKNTDEYWQSEFSEGVTMAEYLDGITLDNIKTTLVVMKLFDDMNLSLTSSEKSSISDYITDLIKERAEGSKNMMNSMLGEYGVNLKLLEQIYRHEAKSAHVYDYLYGDNGVERPSEDELNSFYEENYVHFNMIYINNVYQYVTDDNGNMVTDDDGYYKTEDLDEDVAAKKNALIAQARSRLFSGESFESVYADCDELADRMDYYYSRVEAYDNALYYKLVAAASEAEDYEVSVVQSDMGTCIIQKLPLGEGDWKNSEYSDFFPDSGDYSYYNKACEYAFSEKLKEYYDEITVDEEAIKAFSVAKVIPCYFF